MYRSQRFCTRNYNVREWKYSRNRRFRNPNPDITIYVINIKQTKPETQSEGFPLKNKKSPPITVQSQEKAVLKTLTREAMMLLLKTGITKLDT